MSPQRTRAEFLQNRDGAEADIFNRALPEIYNNYEPDQTRRNRLARAVLGGSATKLRADFGQQMEVQMQDNIARDSQGVERAIATLPITTETTQEHCLATAAIKLSSRPSVMLLLRSSTREDSIKSEFPAGEAYLRLVKFLERYPSPEMFVRRLIKVIDSAEQRLGQKLDEQSFRLQMLAVSALMEGAYGDRLQYWKEWQAMRKELEEREKLREVEHAEKKLRPRASSNFFTPLEADELRELYLRRSVAVHGEVFNGQRLTKEKLERNGLGPRYRLAIDGAEAFYVSVPYDIGEDREAVVLYVPDGDELVARSYYLSNSTGLWRYLPGYSVNGYGGIRHYDKGHSEESITAPAVFQRALAELSGKVEPVQVSNPDLMFAGTARQRNNMEEGTYVNEVNEKPIRLPGNFYAESSYEKNRPEDVRFTSPDWAPSFEQVSMSWQQQSKHYGQITIEVFPSKNGECTYMFCRDANGRAWIGSVEATGEIGSTGLKQKWILGGDLATPADEYAEQDGGYGNFRMQNGNYVDMYKNYLSKIQIIQEYQVSASVRKARGGGETQELSFESKIAKAKSIEDLYVILLRLPVLPGGKVERSGADWCEKIKQVAKGELKIDSITRACGLRSVVERLLEIEQVRKQL